MKSYYAVGGLSRMMPQEAQPAQSAQYYTLGKMPEPIWPATHEPPLSQARQQQDDDLFGPESSGDEQGYAAGGAASGMSGGLGALFDQGGTTPDGPVAGPGTGRSDHIDARLSDGEYIVDAETVALLGDGSTAAGAEALDRMREAIRAHKGAALSKGKISPDARSPLSYLMGDGQ
jgi:hypothetical protein